MARLVFAALVECDLANGVEDQSRHHRQRCTLLVALLAFRVFDVLKPWPISWLDRHLKGGFRRDV